MSIGYSTNLFALRAIRQLGVNSYQLGSALNRLSSGSRINRPSDDAAGLAVASSLSLSQRVYAQGIRNANDSISLLNVASGAAGELSGVLVRLKELAEQAANGSLSVTQRKALDTEAHALTQEYNRIIGATKFNGLGILNLHTRNLNTQLGFGTSEGISAALGSGLQSSVGNGYFGSGGTTGTTAGYSLITGDFNGDGLADYGTADGSAEFKIFLGDGNLGVTGTSAVTPLSGATVTAAVAGDVDGDGDLDIVIGDLNGEVEIHKNNGAGTFTYFDSTTLLATTVSEIHLGDLNNDGLLDIVASQGSTLRALVAATDGTISGTGTVIGNGTVNFQLGDFNGDGILDVLTPQNPTTFIDVYYGAGNGTFGSATTLGSAFGKNGLLQVGDFNHDGVDDFVVSSSGSFRTYTSSGGSFVAGSVSSLTGAAASVEIEDLNGDGIPDLIFSGAAFADTFFGNGDGTFGAKNSTALFGGAIALADFNNDGVLDLFSYVKGLTTDVYLYEGIGQDTTNIGRLDLLTADSALEALDYIDTFIEKVQQELSSLGSTLSRLESGLSNLQNLVVGYQSAESRIVDSDVAAETANLVKTQILQDTIGAILAQANQQPKLALALLTPASASGNRQGDK